MLLKAAEENKLDLTRCIVIGDKWSHTEVDYIARDFEDAVNYIVNFMSDNEEERN